ncbi:UNVERIFIED_CONTAM: putative AC transposase [Sesamum radiatum]|uniref:AC transposase n=1 Tax=Sesamum radiatum TaxID=300843 RepID=A0AAW2V5R6_SESRA
MDLVEVLYTRICCSTAGSYIYRVRNTLINLFVDYGGSFISSVKEPVVASDSGVEIEGALCDFDRWYDRSYVSVNKNSELDIHLDDARFPRTNRFNILDWWGTNGPRLPTLARIARHVLAVPATTVASEATFSVGVGYNESVHVCFQMQ